MIVFDNVSLTYRSALGDIAALTGVSLRVEPGERVVLLGANGSGKSTLSRLANGLLLAEHGSVTVDGMDTRDADRILDVRQRVGMVFQHPDDQIVGTSVEDDIAFGPENLGLEREEIRRRVDAAMASCGLSGLERREPHLLSGGQKQRLAIAGALAMEPAYLVLDEPTSMLDSTGRDSVARVIREVVSSGTGVLQVTHDVSEAEGADRVVVLAEGRIVFEGGTGDLISAHELFAEWGLEAPPAAVVASGLRAAGIALEPGILGVDALTESLWP